MFPLCRIYLVDLMLYSDMSQIFKLETNKQREKSNTANVPNHLELSLTNKYNTDAIVRENSTCNTHDDTPGSMDDSLNPQYENNQEKISRQSTSQITKSSSSNSYDLVANTHDDENDSDVEQECRNDNSCKDANLPGFNMRQINDINFSKNSYPMDILTTVDMEQTIKNTKEINNLKCRGNENSLDVENINRTIQDTEDEDLLIKETQRKDGIQGNKLGLMNLNDTKAGMHGLDTKRINAIIDEASKGSKFYEAKAKNQKRIDTQVDNLINQAKALLPDNIHIAKEEADQLLHIEKINTLADRVIVHVDMDAFYAAVHERDDPTLKTKPMAVGSMGMLSTSNYLARRFGVRAGMPGFIGKKLCPDLCIIPTDFDKYKEIAAVIRKIFGEYDPNFLPMSLDEAYLDITEFLKDRRKKLEINDPSLNESLDGQSELSIDENKDLSNSCKQHSLTAMAELIVKEMRSKIETATNGLTASAGIAPNTLLAKVCSDFNKPNGQFMLKDDHEIFEFVKKLPVRKICGIGNVTEQLLTKVLGVKTCGDLYEKRGLILLLFKPATSHFLLRVSLGIGDNMLSSKDSPRKSISSESTFEDTSDPQKLIEICDELCVDLLKSFSDDEERKLRGRQVTVKIKTYKFEVRTKVTTLSIPTFEYEIISQAARKVLKHLIDNAAEKPLKLRLIGVRLSGFGEEFIQNNSASQPSINQFLRQKSLATDTQSHDSSIRSNATKINPIEPKVQIPEPKIFSTFNCPICNAEVRTKSENAFNAHLDACLKTSDAASHSNSSQIRRRNEEEKTIGKKPKKDNLNYFFNFCANYHDKEKAKRDRKRNLDDFHDMCAEANEPMYTPCRKYEENAQNPGIKALKTVHHDNFPISLNIFSPPNSSFLDDNLGLVNTFNSFEDHSAHFNSNYSRKPLHNPNSSTHTTVARRTIGIETAYPVDRLSSHVDLTEYHMKSCKNYSSMEMASQNEDYEIGCMPKLFAPANDTSNDTKIQISLNNFNAQGDEGYWKTNSV